MKEHSFREEQTTVTYCMICRVTPILCESLDFLRDNLYPVARDVQFLQRTPSTIYTHIIVMTSFHT